MSTGGREQFVRDLSSAQRGLYAYVYTLVPDMAAADDIVQNTNLALWRKFDEGVEIRHFFGLARELARYEALTHMKQRQRDRLRFSPQLLTVMADELDADGAGGAGGVDRFEDQRRALRVCLGRLPEHSRSLVRERYMADGSVQRIAQRLGRTAAAVSQALYRIRNTLAECIETEAGPDGGERT